MLERIFKLSENKTNARTEIVAGITTFLTMAYIIFVNPAILGAAQLPLDAVFAATCLAAALGSGCTGAIGDKQGGGGITGTAGSMIRIRRGSSAS